MPNAITEFALPIHEDFIRIKDDLFTSKGWMPYKRFYPRNVIPPSGYPSSKEASAIIANLAYVTSLKRKVDNDPLIAAELIVIDQWVKLGAQVYFADSDLLDAAANTELPDSYAFSDLKWPVEAFVLMLPHGWAKQNAGKDCNYVLVAKVDAGPRACLLNDKSLNGRVTVDRIAMAFQSRDPGQEGLGCYRIVHNADKPLSEKLPLHKIQDTMDRADADFSNKLSQTILAFLLILGTKPKEAIEYAYGPRNKVSSNGSGGLETYTGLKLGQGYYRKYPRGNTNTGREVASHFRRGHLRNQRHGPGYALTKLIWIEPVMVNGGEE